MDGKDRVLLKHACKSDSSKDPANGNIDMMNVESSFAARAGICIVRKLLNGDIVDLYLDADGETTHGCDQTGF